MEEHVSNEEPDKQSSPNEEVVPDAKGKSSDTIFFSIALVLVVLTSILALFSVSYDQDPLARLNLILLCLLLTSWFVGLCSDIKVRAWATGLLAAGLVAWGIAVAAGGGGWRAIGDVFCFKEQCNTQSALEPEEQDRTVKEDNH